MIGLNLLFDHTSKYYTTTINGTHLQGYKPSIFYLQTTTFLKIFYLQTNGIHLQCRMILLEDVYTNIIYVCVHT